jgi:hypothetical protein
LRWFSSVGAVVKAGEPLAGRFSAGKVSMSTYIVRLILNLSLTYEPLSHGQVVYFVGHTHQFIVANAIVDLKLRGFSSPLCLCDSRDELFRLEDTKCDRKEKGFPQEALTY